MMNLFKLAYGQKFAKLYSDLDDVTLKNYMLRFCDVSSRNLDGRFWANHHQDDSFDFQTAFSFSRDSQKYYWIHTKVLALEKGSVVDVDVKYYRPHLILINLIIVAVGLFLLWASFNQSVFNTDFIFIDLFFLFVMPCIMAFSNFITRNILLKTFIRQFDLKPMKG